MIYHVLPGDAVTEEFKKAEIQGEVIVCREAFVVGPLDGDGPDELWARRAQFFLVEEASDEIVYHDSVAAELEKLSNIEQDDEVNLWFEYELFCSVNLWFCLAMLRDSHADIYRIEPATLSSDQRWLGFGRMEARDLEQCFEARQLFTSSEIELGNQLFEAFRIKDGNRLRELGEQATPRFPYLEEIVQAAAEIEERPKAILKTIRDEGVTEFEKVFPLFQSRAGVYGFGDEQVKSIWDNL